MIKPPQVLLAATALFGCATQDQDSTATVAWGDCVMHQLERVDDGKADPMSLAGLLLRALGIPMSRHMQCSKG